MRHAVKGRKLGRTTSHRTAMFRNQLQSLMESERIITTLPKAKELRPIAEKVITRGKHGTVHDRRWALQWLIKRELVKKVFDEIALYEAAQQRSLEQLSGRTCAPVAAQS